MTSDYRWTDSGMIIVAIVIMVVVAIVMSYGSYPGAFDSGRCAGWCAHENKVGVMRNAPAECACIEVEQAQRPKLVSPESQP